MTDALLVEKPAPTQLPPLNCPTAVENPFTDERLARLRFRLPRGVTWDAFLARLALTQNCGAIVGPHGSGKTMLLEELIPRLGARGFTPHLARLDASSSNAARNALLTRVRGLRAPDLLLLDGAEQFSTREWLSLRSAAGALAGCIITVHRTCRLPTLIETATSLALFDELVTELCGSPLPRGEAAALYGRHRGNLRKVFRELSERWVAVEPRTQGREMVGVQADLFLQ